MADFIITSVEDGSEAGQQRFRRPSVLSDGSIHKLTAVKVVTLKADGKDVTVSKKSTTVKGFVAFTIADGGDDQRIFVGSLFKSKTGKNADGRLVSLRPHGTFVDEVSRILGTVRNPTNDNVRAALQPLVGRSVRVSCETLFAEDDENKPYDIQVRSYDLLDDAE